MIVQRIVWTLLPDPAAAPAADGTVQLSLLASPRLGSDQPGDQDTEFRLSAFPGLVSWPDTPVGLEVDLRLGPATSATVQAQFADATPPDAALWRAMFPPDTPVRPFVFDPAPPKTPVASYPAGRLWGSLREEYVVALDAAAAQGRAERGDEAGQPDVWAVVERLRRVVTGAEDGLLEVARRSGTVPDDLAQDPHGWRRLADFHQTDVRSPVRSPEPPRVEFHRLIAALADHPALLARLGLLRTVRMRLPDGLTGPVSIRAWPTHPAGVSDYRPFTSCVAAGGRLRLAHADGTVAGTHIPLDDPRRFDTVDVDLDAGGLAFRAWVAGLPEPDRSAPPPTLRPPALTSDGIFVAEADRQTGYLAALRRAADDLEADLAAGGDGHAVTLGADDVRQGVRVDVFDETSGRWYPLCRRVGTYTVSGLAEPLPIDDEGMVSDALAETLDHGRPLNLLHHAVFRWNGWSLVAPRPGRMLDGDDELADPTPERQPGLPFTASLRAAPGTLPALRYGRSYRFRARLVDLAGRSVLFSREPTPAEPVSPPVRYARYAPVPSPVLVPRRPVSPGESVAVLVVRTDNRDLTAPRPGQPCERHLLAPKAAVQTLERHGVLDLPGEHRPDPEYYGLLFARDKGTVVGTPDPGARDTPFVDADAMDLPWLPDPLSRGVALHGLPGSPDLRVPWPGGPAWHDRRPLRLVVAAGDGHAEPVQVDPAGRVVRVALAPGADLTVQLSSHLDAGDEDALGVWRWLAEAKEASRGLLDARRGDVLAGRLPQPTPARELRLVHAVRCPVRSPRFGAPVVRRARGQATAVLADDVLAYHGATTVAVHVEATWTETVDDPTRPAPREVHGQVVLEQDDAARRAGWDAAGASVLSFQARLDLGGTRRRVLRCTPVGTSRFVELFAERATVGLGGTQPARVAPGLVPGTVVLRSLGTAERSTYREGVDFLVDHHAGTVARVAGGEIPDGAQVEVTFVAPPVTRAGQTRTVSVPASERPLPPVVRGMVPAFAWSRERGDRTVTSRRRGGLLRVLLQRPWFVSGEGELLAVLVADAGLFLDDATRDRARWLTAWGVDPTRRAGPLPSHLPSAADFPRAVVERQVTVPGVNQLVHAMGHEVRYDPDRGMWYADVEIRHGDAYQPFIRLALARLQPDVVAVENDDLRLSTFVDAGFVQLPPDRETTLRLEEADPQRVRVTVTGSPLLDQLDQPGGATTEVLAVVQVKGSGPDEPAAWRTPDQVPPVQLEPEALPPGGRTRWSGTVQLPSPLGKRPMRVLVRESELLADTTGATARRLIYLDTLEP